MKKRGFIDKVIYIANIVAAIALLFAYVSPHLNPTDFWFISFFGLLYPFALIINGLFIFYWLIRLKKQIFLSLVVVAIGYFYFTKFFRLEEQVDYPPINAIKILSHNQKALGLNEPVYATDDSKKVFDYLNEELFDVYCFQEFFNSKRSGFTPYDSIKKITGAQFRHVEYLVEFRGHQFGLATLSQYPIINKGVVPFEREGTNMCMFTDIDFDGKIVRVYNMHLQSLHLKPKDYQLFKNLDMDQPNKMEGAKNLVVRMKEAFIKREEQATIINKHIQDCPHPVIICGDFNDTPLSYSYGLIRGDLLDCFEENGRGFGSTYNGIFPMLRIDYMFHSPEIKNYYFETVKRDLSDHYPLVGYFGIDENE